MIPRKCRLLVASSLVAVSTWSCCNAFHTVKLAGGTSPPRRLGQRRRFVAAIESMEECPPGYFLDSVNERCQKLGPLGAASQVIERTGPFQVVSRKISTLFGIDPSRISRLGVAFALSYSIISNINGSISLSVAWYMSCAQTGLSPLAPGQWKSLLKAYGTIYAFLQFLRPFRVAAAVAMSKLSAEFLKQTQFKLDCSRGFAIAFQYALGWIVQMILSTFGVAVASWSSGVPVWARHR